MNQQPQLPQPPHKIVDQALNGLANGVSGLIRSAATGIKSAGNSINTSLDEPLRALGITEGPHHVIGDLIDAGVDAGANFPTSGIIDSLKIMGQGMSRALDRPAVQIGKIQIPRTPFQGR